MYTTPRTMLTGRIPEYLESLKAEFETLAHDVNMYKMQRDDYERKLQAQLQELSNIQQTLYDLERNHTKIKQQYEDEILRLRRQLDMSGSTGNSSIPNNSASTYNRSVSPGVPPTGSQPPSLRDARSAPTVPLPGTSGPDKGPVGTGIFYPGGGLAPLDPSKRTGYPPVAPTPNAPPQAPIVKRPRDPQDYYAQQVPPQQQFPSISSIQTPEPMKHKQEIPEEKPVIPPTKAIPSERDRRSNPPPPPPPSDNGNNNMEKDKMNVDNPSGSDWIVGYNPGVQTNLNVELMHTLEHNSVVCCVKFSGDGKYMATGCNKSAQVYDIESGEKVHTFSEDIGKDGDLYIRSVCFSPDGRYLACGAEDKTVKLWDIETKRLHHTFIGHELDIYSLDFSKDGRFIVSGSGDKKAKIWDVEKGECLFTLGNEEVGPKDGVTSVAFSPDGRLVAAGSLDRIVRLWDAQTGYFLERYEGHMDSVYSVAFSPDGKSLASGSLDKTLKLWDLSGSRARSRCRSNFTGHKDFVLSVAFSPDGNWLISGSKDRSVQFWDPKSAVSHMMLQGHKNSVISVAVSPVGGYFATGSGDFRARIWKYE